MLFSETATVLTIPGFRQMKVMILKTILALGAALAVFHPLLTVAGEQPSVRHGWTVRGNVPISDFVVQCHRGAGVLAPENTVIAFEMAWKMGAIPEADLRVTQDGVIVAFHDNNFKRVAPNAPRDLVGKKIADLTVAQLEDIDVGSWRGANFADARIPRLAEVFERMRGQPKRRLYVDIKEVSLPELARQARSYGVSKQLILASTHHPLIREWKSVAPEAATLLWMGGTQTELEKRLEELRKTKFADVSQLQIHVRQNTNAASNEPFALRQKFIRDLGDELRSHGILFQALPWNIADARVYSQLMDLGVASFATDHPDVTLRAIREYLSASSTK